MITSILIIVIVALDTNHDSPKIPRIIGILSNIEHDINHNNDVIFRDSRVKSVQELVDAEKAMSYTGKMIPGDTINEVRRGD